MTKTSENSIKDILAICADFVEKQPWQKDNVLIVRFDEVEKCIYGFKPKDVPLATDTLMGLYAFYPEGSIYKLCPAYANHPVPYWKEIKNGK